MCSAEMLQAWKHYRRRKKCIDRESLANVIFESGIWLPDHEAVVQ